MTKRRGAGEGGISLYATKNGERYSIVYRAVDPTTGAVKQFRTRGFATRKEAQKELRERLRNVEKGVHVARSVQTLAEWIDLWIKAERTQVRPSTWASYDRNLRIHVVPSLGSRKLQGLTPSDFSALYAQLVASGRADHAAGSGLSRRTVIYIHCIVRKCLQAAVDQGGLIASNPVAKAKPPKLSASGDRHEQLRYWNAAQLGEFLRRSRHQRHHAAWLVLATTGMRRGEALGLTWPEVDLDGQRLHVRKSLVDVQGEAPVWSDPKTAKGRRTVDLDEVTVNTLRSQRAAQAQERLLVGAGYRDHGLVFAMPDGRPIHPDRFAREFVKTVERSDLPRIRLHDLRHTWAVLALLAGVHPKVVQERLGHSNISITLDTYSHVLPTMHTDAAEQVAGLIFGGSA